MATTEETRRLMEAADTARRAVIRGSLPGDENTNEDYRRAADTLYAGMMALAQIWRTEASGLDRGKRGNGARIDTLIAAAELLAGHAGRLIQVAAAEWGGATPPGPTPATQALDIPDPTITQDAQAMLPVLLDPVSTTPARLSWADFGLVVDALPIPDHASFSSMQALADCGVRYALDKATGADVPTWATVGGSAIHKCVEWIERATLSAPLSPDFATAAPDQRSAAGLWATYLSAEIASAELESKTKRDTWRASSKGLEGYDWWRVEGLAMLRRYLAYWDAKRAQGWRIWFDGEHTGLELDLSIVTADGHRVQVIIDQVWVRPDGSLFISDVKSGKTKPAGVFQLALGAHAVRAVHESYADTPIAGGFFDARAGSHDQEVEDLTAVHPLAEVEYRTRAFLSIVGSRAYLPRVSDFAGGCTYCPQSARCPARAS